MMEPRPALSFAGRIALSCGAATVLCAAGASTAMAADLTVKVEGIREAVGLVRIELDASEAAWENKAAPASVVDVPAVKGDCTYTFRGLAPGLYGVGVFHDANRNGQLDMNLLGIPKEDFGFSNNPDLMRKPTFKEARFVVGDGGSQIVVRLRHFF